MTGKFKSRTLALITCLLVMGCQSSPVEKAVKLDPVQGTEANIASLTQVVNKNPNSAEAYNVRGTAYGRAGQNRAALEDFTRALQLNPKFYQAYANRALIYRQVGEPSNAIKDYTKALKINPQYDDAYIDYEKVHKLAPHLDFVKKDLIRASIVSQRKEMTKKWKKEFSGVELGEQWKDRENGELVLLYQQGWGARKRPNPVWLRVPKLYPLRSRTAKARLDITGAIGAETEKLFSVEQVAIQTLDDEYAGLIAKRIAGRVVKDTVANEIGKKNKGLGNLARLAMDIVDQADLRQWSTLPQSLQVARVYLKEGTYKVRVQGLTGAGVPSGESMPEKEIVIQKGKKTFLNWRSFY